MAEDVSPQSHYSQSGVSSEKTEAASSKQQIKSPPSLPLALENMNRIAQGTESAKHLDNSDGSSLLGSLKGSSLAQRTASDLPTDRSNLESPSEFASRGALQSTPMVSASTDTVVESDSEINGQHSQDDQALLESLGSPHSLQGFQSTEVSFTTEISPSASNTSESRVQPDGTDILSTIKDGLHQSVWASSAAKGWDEDIDSSVDAQTPTQLVNVEFLPAKTATKEELAQMRLGSQSSSVNSSLLGTPTNSYGPYSDSLLDTQDIDQGIQTRKSPRTELIGEACKELSTAKSIDQSQPSTPVSVNDGDLKADQPNTSLMESPNTTISMPTSVTSSHSEHSDSLLPVLSDTHSEGEHSLEEAKSHGASFSSHSSILQSSDTMESEPSQRAELLKQASSVFTSITAAVEATQHKDYSEDDDSAIDWHDESSGIPFSTVRNSQSDVSDSQSNLASSLDSKTEAVLELEQVSEPNQSMGATSPAISILSNRALMGSPNIRMGPSSQKSNRDGLTLQETRLAELDSLLSSSHQLPHELDLDSKSPQNPHKSNLGHDWEFVEDTLSSRMQAITKWTDHQADNTVNRAFGITSETTDSMGELMAEIESHPLDSWQPDDMDDDHDINFKSSSTRQVLWCLQPTLLKVSSVKRWDCF